MGKDAGNEVLIQDRYLSGRHLQVTRCEAGLHVRDLNSTNGTFQDGTRLFEAQVPLNSVLRVGESELLSPHGEHAMCAGAYG